MFGWAPMKIVGENGHVLRKFQNAIFFNFWQIAKKVIACIAP